MKRATILCLAAVCFLWADSATRAGMLTTSGESTTPTYWSYKLSVDPHFTVIGNFGHDGFIFMHGGRWHNEYTAPHELTDVSSKVFTWTDAPKSDPLIVSAKPFAVDVKIRDESGATKDFIFKGTFNGDLWRDGSTLSPTFSSPLVQSYHVGNFTYQVSFENFHTVWSEGGLRVSEFTFNVDHHNPEPSSLVLAGIGVPLFGMVLRRRRRA